LNDYLTALNTVKQLEVELVLPGHEHPFNNLPARIDEIIQHHQQRNSEILNTLKDKAKTAYQVATELTWRPGTRGNNWQNLSPLDRRLAILETLSHLEFMRFEGKLAKFSRDGTIYYQLPDATEKN
jgi:hypothetical protein